MKKPLAPIKTTVKKRPRRLRLLGPERLALQGVSDRVASVSRGTGATRSSLCIMKNKSIHLMLPSRFTSIHLKKKNLLKGFFLLLEFFKPTVLRPAAAVERGTAGVRKPSERRGGGGDLQTRSGRDRGTGKKGNPSHSDIFAVTAFKDV